MQLCCCSMQLAVLLCSSSVCVPAESKPQYEALNGSINVLSGALARISLFGFQTILVKWMPSLL